MYTGFVKNVTISLDEQLLERARERARTMGQSFNEYVRALLGREVSDDPLAALEAAWSKADAEGLRLDGPMPSRDEIYADRLERYPHSKR